MAVMATRKRMSRRLAGDREAQAFAATLGAQAAATRRRMRLNQTSVAARMGISRGRLGDLEQGNGEGAPLGLWIALGLAIGRPLRVEFSKPTDRRDGRRRASGDPGARPSAGPGEPATPGRSRWRRGRATRAARPTSGCATTGAGSWCSSSAGTRSATWARRPDRPIGSSPRPRISRSWPAGSGRSPFVASGSSGRRPATAPCSRAIRRSSPRASQDRPPDGSRRSPSGADPPPRAGPRLVRRGRDPPLRVEAARSLGQDRRSARRCRPAATRRGRRARRRPRARSSNSNKR